MEIRLKQRPFLRLPRRLRNVAALSSQVTTRSFYIASYWSLGTVIYPFKDTFSGFFPSFREVLLARTTSINFFPPSFPSATFVRLPVYFLLIAWAKCFPHNLSIARQCVAIVAVKMYRLFRSTHVLFRL